MEKCYSNNMDLTVLCCSVHVVGGVLQMKASVLVGRKNCEPKFHLGGCEHTVCHHVLILCFFLVIVGRNGSGKSNFFYGK